MAATEHRLANRHEVGNRVVSIADKLCAVRVEQRMRAIGDGTSWRLFAMSAWSLSEYPQCRVHGTHSGFRMVQFHAPREPALCQQAKLRDDELVDLSRCD